jgi:hypothetical protein
MEIIPDHERFVNTLSPEYICLTGDAKMASTDGGLKHGVSDEHRSRQLKAAIDHLEARRWRLAEVQSRVLLAADP